MLDIPAPMTDASIRLPAEWEPHRATWIAWPHAEVDFPGKVQAVQWVYVEIVRALLLSERVEILCDSSAIADLAKEQLSRSSIRGDIGFHVVRHDRGWLRDSLPTAIKLNGTHAWMKWKFTAWERFSNYSHDAAIPDWVAATTTRPILEAKRPDNGAPLVMEGGVFDTDGEGTLLVTEECLLSHVQERNSGLGRADYERVFEETLGIKKLVWLGIGCEGDTTHGHVDDIARFVGSGKVVLAVERNESDFNHAPSMENLARLKQAHDARGRRIETIELPFPHRIECDGYRLPASYANFYISNAAVLVPTFNCESDGVALEILRGIFPHRRVIGIHAVDLVLGEGTIHCLTQQEPA
jgi:agmatine deiminase